MADNNRKSMHSCRGMHWLQCIPLQQCIVNSLSIRTISNQCIPGGQTSRLRNALIFDSSLLHKFSASLTELDSTLIYWTISQLISGVQHHCPLLVTSRIYQYRIYWDRVSASVSIQSVNICYNTVFFAK